MAEIFIAPQDVQDEIIAAARADERRKVLLEVAEMADFYAKGMEDEMEADPPGASPGYKDGVMVGAHNFRFFAEHVCRARAKAGKE